MRRASAERDATGPLRFRSPRKHAIHWCVRRRGSGKTLAAFLPVMSRLAELRDADELLARTYCVYVSPLRALGYDVEHNLRRPLREMGLLERPNTECC